MAPQGYSDSEGRLCLLLLMLAAAADVAQLHAPWASGAEMTRCPVLEEIGCNWLQPAGRKQERTGRDMLIKLRFPDSSLRPSCFPMSKMILQYQDSCCIVISEVTG